MSPKKIYAVVKGRSVGLFRTWEDCKDSVSGYPGAIYKSFGCLGLACAYLKVHNIDYVLPNGQKTLF